MMNLASIWSLVDSNSVSTHNCLSTWEVRCRSHCWCVDTEECSEASYWTVSEGVYVFRGIQHSWSAYSNVDITRLLTIILNSVLEELVCYVSGYCVILFLRSSKSQIAHQHLLSSTGWNKTKANFFPHIFAFIRKFPCMFVHGNLASAKRGSLPHT